MVCDLERVFDALAHLVLASTTANDHFIFSSTTLPVPPIHMATDRLIITKGQYQYNSYYRSDLVQWLARNTTYRHLSLLILSVVLHEGLDRVQLELLNPESAVRHLIIEYPYPTEPPVGYSTRPYVFNYFPRLTEKHPWMCAPIAPQGIDLPCFYLSNLNDFVATDEQWSQRDTIRGFGSDKGAVRLAELLLNATRPQNDIGEYQLEGDGGFRGVGPHSAEARLLFPDILGWTDLEIEHKIEPDDG